MAIATRDIFNIYDGLIHKFLYKNDLNCIHILLNLYDLEENFTNIRPKYMSIFHLKRQIRRILKSKKGNHFISSNLGQLIHEDINRLELYIYLEGYKHGYCNNHWVNILENITVQNICVDQLYNKTYLYHFDNETKKIIDIKSSIATEIQSKEKKDKSLTSIIKKYCNCILKLKIYNLNNFLDKQLVIDYNSNMYTIGEGDTILTLKELDYIYMQILKLLLKGGLKLYKEAYWHGLNDRVLKRYR